MSDDLRAQFGSARRPERPSAHPRPAGACDPSIDADGQVSAALEIIEHAHGLLYGFHRMSGQADLALQDAAKALRDTGHQNLAAEMDEVLIGRDLLPGMRSFQVGEAYDQQ